MKSLENIIITPMTDDELEEFLPKSRVDNIIKYSELSKYNDLEDLLPYNNSYKILLIEYLENSGHWVSILRYNNTIEIFNSFGDLLNRDAFIDDDILNKQLNQYTLFLNKLINKEKEDNEFKFIYNTIQFQKKNININTCGRHVVLRIIMLIYFNMNLKQYILFMKETKKKLNINYDEIVSLIIS